MKAFYTITSGGISDLIGQLVNFAGVCFCKGIEPALARFTSIRYQPDTNRFVRHETSSVEKQLFGDIPEHPAPEATISMAEFAALDEKEVAARGGQSILVSGDKHFSVMPGLIKKIRDHDPQKWSAAKERGYQFTRELLHNGRIYQRFLGNSRPAAEKTGAKTIVTAHCRLGDVALLCRDDFRDTGLHASFKTDYFINYNKTREEVYGLMHGSSASTAGKRILKRPKISSFVEALNMLKEEPGGGTIHSVFCSDGYSHAAVRFIGANKPPMSVNEVEDIFNRVYLSGVMESFDECLIGENFDLLLSTVDIALQADVMIMGQNSAFPLSLRRVLGIEEPRVIRAGNEFDEQDDFWSDHVAAD